MKNLLLNNKLLLIIISSIFTGLAQQPLRLGFLAWFSIIPLIYVLDSTQSYKKNIYYSFIWGFLYCLNTVFWLAFNIGTHPFAAFISMILTVLILSTNTVLLGLIWHKMKSRKYKLLLFAITWVSIEYIRSYGILGFPWIDLGNTQTDYFYLIQNAEFLGLYGISFWVLVINVTIYKIIKDYSVKRNIILLISVFIIPFILGYFLNHRLKIQEIDDELLIVQPNISLIDKRDYNKRYENLNMLIELSKKYINNKTSLILWPESALPYNNVQDPKTLNYIINNLIRETDIYLLAGNVIYDKKNHYNSSVLINKYGIQGIYNKQQLVPVAEYVPMSDWFPLLKKLNLGQANFSRGKQDVLFEVSDYKFSSLICFESTFPEINRRHAKKGADFFTYLVNDGWYTTAPEPQQHMKQSIFRSIENRKTVVRCANTGISAVINPSGKISQTLPLNEQGVITSFIKKTNKSTFYTNYGNVFAIVMLIIVCISFFNSIKKDEKNI